MDALANILVLLCLGYKYMFATLKRRRWVPQNDHSTDILAKALRHHEHWPLGQAVVSQRGIAHLHSCNNPDSPAFHYAKRVLWHWHLRRCWPTLPPSRTSVLGTWEGEGLTQTYTRDGGYGRLIELFLGY